MVPSNARPVGRGPACPPGTTGPHFYSRGLPERGHLGGCLDRQCRAQPAAATRLPAPPAESPTARVLSRVCKLFRPNAVDAPQGLSSFTSASESGNWRRCVPSFRGQDPLTPGEGWMQPTAGERMCTCADTWAFRRQRTRPRSRAPRRAQNTDMQHLTAHRAHVLQRLATSVSSHYPDTTTSEAPSGYVKWVSKLLSSSGVSCLV